MQVNIDNNDIMTAARRGLELLRNESISIPAAWKNELVCLDMILQNVIDGQFVITPVEQQKVSLQPATPPDAPQD